MRARKTLPATPGEPLPAELRIDFHDLGVIYMGAAAELQSEGLIPVDFQWPRGTEWKRWQAAGFDFSLRRTRRGAPGQPWLNRDAWQLRVKVVGRDFEWAQRRALQRKADALRDKHGRLTREGGALEGNDFRWCSRRASQDAAFQAFKSKVPGLTSSSARS